MDQYGNTFWNLHRCRSSVFPRRCFHDCGLQFAYLQNRSMETLFFLHTKTDVFMLLWLCCFWCAFPTRSSSIDIHWYIRIYQVDLSLILENLLITSYYLNGCKWWSRFQIQPAKLLFPSTTKRRKYWKLCGIITGWKMDCEYVFIIQNGQFPCMKPCLPVPKTYQMSLKLKEVLLKRFFIQCLCVPYLWPPPFHNTKGF